MRSVRRQNRSTDSSFLRQGLLIVLPVVLLTILGLFSLRQDRRLAEQDAQQRAQEILRQVSADVSRELPKRIAEFSLLQPAVFNHSGEPLSPPEWSAAPTPPDWFVSLNSEQEQLWMAARRLEYDDRPATEVTGAWNEFLETKPGPDASANVEFSLLRLVQKSQPTAESMKRLLEFGAKHAHHKSELGLPLSAVSFAMALSESSRDEPDDDLIRGLAVQIENPSALTPHFLAQIQSRFENASAEKRSAVQSFADTWRNQERQREIMRKVRDQFGWPTRSRDLWVDTSSGRWLVMLQPGRRNHPDGRPTMLGRFFPKALLEQSFEDTLGESVYELPPYFSLGVELANDRVYPPKSSGVTNAADSLSRPLATLRHDVMGSLMTLATNQLVASVEASPDDNTLSSGPQLVLSLFLTDPAALYARQRQRTFWFAALIVAASATAMAGLMQTRATFKRQQQLNDLKTNFVSSVSHELRAPIASVRLLAESLERGKVQESTKQHEYFRLIVQECRRLSTLVANVLDFSRIEQGRKQYEMESTDVAALVEQTIELAKISAIELGVKLELSVELSCTQMEMRLDGAAIQQAIANLIDNALKHSPKGGEVRVSLRYDEPGKTLNLEPITGTTVGCRFDLHTTPVFRIAVEDEGPGIPSSEHERIFERFYRLGSELRRETQGVGIGLSIVQHIVEAHGGRVRIESPIDTKGSRFTIELPLLEVSGMAAVPETPIA